MSVRCERVASSAHKTCGHDKFVQHSSKSQTRRFASTTKADDYDDDDDDEANAVHIN